MKKKYILGNWKMNTTYSEAMVLAGGIEKRVADEIRVEVIVFPPFPWLVSVKERCRNVKIGAQNMYYKTHGSYTGEVSGEMLKGLVDYVLLGHSERRSVFGEDNATICAKLKTALNLHLKPVVAIGEYKKLDIDGLTQDDVDERVLKSDIIASLYGSTSGIGANDWQNIIVAYEPIWAVGSNNPASSHYVSTVIESIRNAIAKKTSRGIANSVPILYGGSITRHNVADFALESGIDGVLVGASSLRIVDFTSIVDIFSKSLEK